MNRTLSQIKASGKGIWGIECPEGSVFDAKTFFEDCDVCCFSVLLFVKEHSGKRFFSSEYAADCSELELSRVAKKVKSQLQSCTKARIGIADFHLASEEEKYNLLCEARRIQEQERSVSFQFIVFGRWSHYLIRAYHDQHGSSLSPPTDSKNSAQAPYANEAYVFGLLWERQLMAAAPTDLDVIGCALLLEQTGGDRFLVDQVIDRLDSSPWTDSLELNISELESAPEVCEEMLRRLGTLSKYSLGELKCLLRAHSLLCSIGACEPERLWLSGFIRKRRRSGNEFVMEIASPVTDAVARKILGIDQCGLALPEEVCYRRNSISVEAYRRVADLENLLRNVIVSEWRSRFENKWKERLTASKTPVNGSGENFIDTEELRRVCELAGFTIAPKEKDQDNGDVTIETQKRSKTETLLAAANNWQQRQQSNHAIRFQNDNTMHFLTTESLVGILEDKKQGFCGVDGQIFRKQELFSALSEYIAIRAAVAHNQPLTLAVIGRLDDLLERFSKWITVYADRSRA